MRFAVASSRFRAACATVAFSWCAANACVAAAQSEASSPNRYLPGAEDPASVLRRPRFTLTPASESDRSESGTSSSRKPPDGDVFDVEGNYVPPSRDDYLDWSPQFLPRGLIYRSYLAGVKESRVATVFDYDRDRGWLWDVTFGGRVGLFRFGSVDPVRPEGFQIDAEGSAQPRLNLNDDEDLQAVDFRAGLPITYGIGPWQMKFAYYHLSAHAGDEFLLKNPTFTRLNYSRDALVLGHSYYLTDDVRAYAEADWAFYSDVSEPWQFQFGLDYSPLVPEGIRGAPFAAVNAHLREEVDFGGNLVVQAGWQWRPRGRGQLLRMGLQYYNGKSNQFEFYRQSENKFGLGLWYDY